MQNDILVRKPVFEDFPTMAEIKVRGWQTAYRGIVDEAYLRKLSADQICESMRAKKKERFLVADVNGEIVGFCRYRLCEDTDVEGNCHGEISELYVKPERKRMGIGRMLFLHVMEDLKNSGRKSVILGCFSENHSAQAFYRRMNGIYIGSENFEIEGRKYPVECYRFAL